MDQILDRIEKRLGRIEDKLDADSRRVDDRLAHAEADIAGMRGQVRIGLTIITTVLLSVISTVISHFAGGLPPPTGGQ